MNRRPKCLGRPHVSFEDQTNNPSSIIVIHATQHYMCFLQMDLSGAYLDDLDNPSPTHMLYVSATPWFDLSQESGRRNVLLNICGIMQFAITEQG